MNKILASFLVAILGFVFTTSASALTSLRGELELNADAKMSKKTKVKTVPGGFKRSYKIQPPLVPHKVAKYKINLKSNGCLKCHSERTYKKEKAPKIGDTHYVGRDGKVSKKMSPRRYFCNQCHAPQVTDEKLVENTF